MLLLVDSDVFCKLGVAGLLDQSLSLLGVSADQCGRLPALPHMLRRGKLPKVYGQPACDALAATAQGMAVAPAPSTIWLERLASVPMVDPGEAQLFASAAENALTVLTGDKRALSAVAAVEGFASALEGRIVTFEAILLALCARLGEQPLRAALQPMLSIDRTVGVCFSAGNARPREALLSYFDHLKIEVRPLRLWDPATEAAQ